MIAEYVESDGRKDDSMFKSRKLQAPVRIGMGRDMVGLYRPYDKCTKTAHNIINVLWSRYPEVKVPDAEEFDGYPHTEEELSSFPVYYVLRMRLLTGLLDSLVVLVYQESIGPT